MCELVLKIFISGASLRMREVVNEFENILKKVTDVTARIEVIDVLTQPDVAERYNIRAVPTILREEPPPRIRVLGDRISEDLVRYILKFDGSEYGEGGDG